MKKNRPERSLRADLDPNPAQSWFYGRYELGLVPEFGGEAGQIRYQLRQIRVFFPPRQSLGAQTLLGRVFQGFSWQINSTLPS